MGKTRKLKVREKGGWEGKWKRALPFLISFLPVYFHVRAFSIPADPTISAVALYLSCYKITFNTVSNFI